MRRRITPGPALFSLVRADAAHDGPRLWQLGDVEAKAPSVKATSSSVWARRCSTCFRPQDAAGAQQHVAPFHGDLVAQGGAVVVHLASVNTTSNMGASPTTRALTRARFRISA